MKFIAFAFFLLPLFIFGQVGDSYKNYLHSDFYQFFQASEIKRTSYQKGDLREIKTGGFQDYITIYMYTDSASMIIHEATLEIDREWMEAESTADLSRDLVKSFLLDFIAKPDQPKAMAAGDLLFNRKTTQD
ncbi:MAG TPA: hypothetical protein VGI82_01835, partial [Chitinophagaceae bacterium]